jgi:hypothetical protein
MRLVWYEMPRGLWNFDVLFSGHLSRQLLLTMLGGSLAYL